MIRFEVGADDLLHSRFAVSPLFELDTLLRTLSGVGRLKGPLVLLERLRPDYERLLAETDLPILEALFAPRYGPTFLCPPPRTMAQTIDEDLAAMRATPLATARAEIAESLRQRPCSPDLRERLERDDIVDRLADVMEIAWRVLFEPLWPQLRAVCERDVLHRSGELGRRGWAAALKGLSRRVRWRDGGIELVRFSPEVTIPLGGKGLLFIPSVFIWPEVATHFDDPWPKAIIYPARGVADLWRPDGSPAHDALADLIGRSRARLLITLAAPASTTQLAKVSGLAVGAVNDHLRVLQRAGLLESARDGRSVIYRRTRFGDGFVDRSARTSPET